MKYLKKLFFSTILFYFVLITFSCKPDKKKQVDYSKKVENKDNVIEVVTNVMDFVTVDTIKSGWNTFKYINKSNEPHFLLFDDYPDGKTLDTIKAVVMPPFDKGMALIMEGNMDAALVEFGKLPDWFPQVQFVGGTGLISPGREANVTVKLKPGLHIMECYVKMANGMFHASMGMAKEFWVLDEDTGNHPPKASINISISSSEGINYDKPISKGKQIFSVYYGDQTVHEHFLGHDVNLVKLDENANLDELEAWMNWATPTGLMTPTPEGVTFLGGTNDAPAGSSLYFTVDLSPGNYAFISEVPNASKKGMLKIFTITE